MLLRFVLDVSTWEIAPTATLAAQHVIVLVENVFVSNNKLYNGTEFPATGTGPS